MWGISSRLLQQSAATAPYLEQVAPPDLEHGVAPLGPPAPVQPVLLGRGVLLLATAPGLGRGLAPPDHRPWPGTWSSSSWLLLRSASQPARFKDKILILDFLSPDGGEITSCYLRHPFSGSLS